MRLELGSSWLIKIDLTASQKDALSCFPLSFFFFFWWLNFFFDRRLVNQLQFAVAKAEKMKHFIIHVTTTKKLVYSVQRS